MLVASAGSDNTRLLGAFLIALAALGSTGCSKEIGDACTVNADCNGSTSDRICDTTQPSGYCTVFSCSRGSCPSEARCVAYGTSVPGCGYNDRQLPRTARSFCLKECSENSDCRDGYICADPSAAPWNATILDDGKPRVCIVAASFLVDGAATPTAARDADASVCRIDEGQLDASFSSDAGHVSDAGSDGSVQDASTDSGAADGGSDTADSGL